MTFYKYAQKNVENEIDWGQISKSLSDSLIEEERLREEKKAEIDQATNEFSKTISDAPMGESTDINAFTASNIEKVQQMRLIQDRLLKSGKLSLRDYTMQRQNLSDSVNTLYGTIKSWNTTYKQGIERIEKGISSGLEADMLSMVEEFGNLNGYDTYVNPTDGIMYVGKKEKNPQTGQMELSKDQNKLMSVNSLKAMSNQKINRFDTDAYIGAKVKQIGEFATAYREKGYDISKKSIQNNPKYAEMKKYGIEVITKDPNKVAQVLRDDLVSAPNGKQYSITLDPNDKSPDKILAVRTNTGLTFKPTEQQSKAVESFLSSKWDGMVDSVISKVPVETKTSNKVEYSGEDKNTILRGYNSIIKDNPDFIAWYLQIPATPRMEKMIKDGKYVYEQGPNETLVKAERQVISSKLPSNLAIDQKIDIINAYNKWLEEGGSTSVKTVSAPQTTPGLIGAGKPAVKGGVSRVK